MSALPHKKNPFVTNNNYTRLRSSFTQSWQLVLLVFVLAVIVGIWVPAPHSFLLRLWVGFPFNRQSFSRARENSGNPCSCFTSTYAIVWLKCQPRRTICFHFARLCKFLYWWELRSMYMWLITTTWPRLADAFWVWVGCCWLGCFTSVACFTASFFLISWTCS